MNNKKVNITTSATGTIIANFVQIYKGEEQVLESKSFASIKNAKKWADKILNKSH
jgi:hypothetical protein